MQGIQVEVWRELHRGVERWRVRVRGADGKSATSAHHTEAEAREVAAAARGQRDGSISIARAVGLYRAHLVAKGNKASSIATTCTRIEAWTAGLGTVADWTPQRAAQHYADRASQVAADTHRNELAELKTFAAWLVEHRYLRRSPLESVRATGRRAHGKAQLRRIEARAYVAHALTLRPAERWGALAPLLLGLRAEELLTLRVRDLDEDEEGRLLVLVAREGGKSRAARRELVVPEMLAGTVRELAAGQLPEGYLLASPGASSGRRTKTWLRKLVARVCEDALCRRVCPHGLRGTRASLALEAGAGAEALARELGHESPAITRAAYAAPGAEESPTTARVLRVVAGGLSEPERPREHDSSAHRGEGLPPQKSLHTPGKKNGGRKR